MIKHRFPYFRILLFACICLCVAHNGYAQKEKKKNKKSFYQNLTTKYNILFNANEIIAVSVDNLAQNYPYQFDQLLPVYLTPEESLAESLRGNMDVVIQKCDRIIEEKSRSKFVDRAYLIKGISSFYKGGYFLAAEYFDYVSQEYDTVKNTNAEAKLWKARCYTKIKNYKIAHQSLDSAMDYLGEANKKIRGMIFSTAAQLAISEENYPKAIEYLNKSLENATNSNDRIRWDYVLAQIYDRQNQSENASIFYNKVARSNANFNLSFNASLNKIRIDAFKNPTEDLRTKALLALTRDEKNEEYLDQIYYQIGNVYLNDRKYDLAIENFKTSIRKSNGNDAQKGLSYLAVGDVSFQYQNNYLVAKNYYDTAINILPKNFKNYNLIVKKANNLQDLADYYSTISNQDTLQYLVSLPAQQREEKMTKMADKIFTEKRMKDSVAKALYDVMHNPKNPNYNPYLDVRKPLSSNSDFYFNNTNLVRQGYNEFKRIWGNRALSDNWRISNESIGLASDNSAEEARKAEEAELAAAKKDVLSGNDTKDIKEYVDNMRKQLPLTPQKIAISDKLIIESYYKMGAFYRDILEDKPASINAFETLMRRFPNNYRSAETYYNLYRLLVKDEPNKANTYRDLLVRNFPQTVYAKLLSDPNYAKNFKGELAQINDNYTVAFDSFIGKKYRNVITQAESSNSSYPNNDLAAQFDYLKAISVGHTANVDSLISQFSSIADKYPKDGLITPLVNSHIAFLKNNYAYYKPRPIALTDADDAILLGLNPNEPIIKGYIMEDYDSFQRKEMAAEKALKTPLPTKKKEDKTAEIVEALKKENELAKVNKSGLGTNPLITDIKNPSQLNLPKADSSKLNLDRPELDAVTPTNSIGNTNLNTNKLGINAKVNGQGSATLLDLKRKFTDAASKEYYYVVNIFDESAVLSASRFGIGQFIRANYTNANITHRVIELDKNQLIYVGPFPTMEALKDFQSTINPNLSSIMKLNPDDYEPFTISKENLDKLNNTNMTNDYILYYKIMLK